MHQACVAVLAQALLQPSHLSNREVEQLRRLGLAVLALLDAMQHLESITLLLAHLDPVSRMHAHSCVLLAQGQRGHFYCVKTGHFYCSSTVDFLLQALKGLRQCHTAFR